MADAAEASDGPVDGTVYSVRAHAFVKRRTYRLLDDALAWEEDGAKPDGVLYRDISEVRLAYAPTRAAPNRYRAQIVFRQGGMAQIFNQDYRGFADFKEQNAAYTAFIRELHRRLAAAGGTTVFRRGNKPIGYVLNLLLTVFILAGLAFAIVFLVLYGMIWIAAVKIVLIIIFLPVLIRYIRRARPATYNPLAVPDNVLPTG